MAGTSIKFFHFTQKLCEFCGIYSLKPNQNRYHMNSINWFEIFCLNQYFISTAIFLFFGAKSMAEYGKTSYLCLTTVVCDIFCLTALQQAENIPKFVGNWEAFVEKREQSTNVYRDVNEKIEKITKWFSFCFLSTLFAAPIPALITFVNYYVLNLGEESFMEINPGWVPLDKKTPFGYFTAWFSQFAGVGVCIAIVLPFYCFILGSSFLFICMAEDITEDLTAFDRTLKTPEDRDCDELKKRFSAAIQAYSDAERCVEEFNQICKYALFNFFTWILLDIASSLVTLQFQLWGDDSGSGEMDSTMIQVFWPYATIFLICELGERVFQHFELFDQELEQCNWNLLSIRLQRMYLIFLSSAQQPVYIESYAGIKCSRETFKTITYKGFSYFMALRQMDI